MSCGSAGRPALAADRTISHVRDEAEVARILVVAAHPDDVDFGLAGTVATWTDAGIEVVYCIVTNGDAGGRDPSVSRADMAVLRQAEQIAAAKCVGVSDVRFLGYPDGRVEASLDLRRDIARVIRQVRPDRVASSRPSATTRASRPAIPTTARRAPPRWTPCTRTRATRSPSPNWPRKGWRPGSCRKSGSPAARQPTHFVDITATFDRKVAALRAHESQTAHMDNLEEMLRGWLSRSAALGGLAEGRLAEAFQVIETG